MVIDDVHVYWASRTEGRLYRADRATGIPEVLADGFVLPDELAPEADYTRDDGMNRIAIDDAYVYIADTRGLFRVRK